MSPRRTKRAAGTSPLLALLIEALEEQDRHERPGEAKALRAFGELALRQVPARGVFAPAESDLYMAIDEIASKHLGLKEPRRLYLDATTAVEPFGSRDGIQSAVNHLMTVSDQAYFYAGLAFGITLVDFCSTR